MDRYAKAFTVRWGDCDLNGHVRNTVYDEYGIETRVGYIVEHGFGFDEFRKHHLGPVVVRMEIDYLKELDVGEKISVDLAVVGLSPDDARWKIAHEIHKENGKRAARIVILGGWMDLQARRLVPAPAALARIWRDCAKDPAYEDLPPLGSSRRA
jgi:acyl-CoA thioester hydrolase